MRLTRDLLLRRFGDLWPVHHRAFTTLVVECRRLFDGDLDEMLILSAIGERTLSPQRAAGLTYQKFLNGERNETKTGRINTQSIADSTGIPRETVRRKVIRLIDRGWVKQNDDGSFEVAEKAAVDLAPATQATFDYLLAVGHVMISMVNDEGARATGRRTRPEGPANG
jgi:hypothetical protein